MLVYPCHVSCTLHSLVCWKHGPLQHSCSHCIFTGQIDYLGQDSFENIQKKIDETLTSKTASAIPTSSPFAPASKSEPPVHASVTSKE